jgi:hypothetical protein
MLTTPRSLFARIFAARKPRRQRGASARSAAALELLETRALLAAFGSGNLVVERIGDGSTALTSAAAQVSILEYTTAGSSVQTISLPSTGVDQVTDSGSATSNGYLNSYNGYLGLPGYNSAAGTGSVAGTNTKVGTVYGVDGNRASRTLFPTDTTIYAGNNFRSVIATGANTFYTTGTGGGTSGGVWYYNGSSFTQISVTGTGTLTNMRNVEIYNNQLYVSSSSGAFVGISSIGSGLPTTSGQAATLQINMGAGASPYGFVMFDTDNNGALDLAYIADDRTAAGGGLQKWTFNGSAWSQSWALLVNASNQLSGTALSGYAGMRGLTGTYANGTATLYATTSAETANNRLISITDSGSTPSTATTVAAAGANFVFRGLDFTPVAPDTTSPAINTLSPADNATNVAAGSNLIVTFDENVATGSGNILIRKSSDNSTAFTIDITSSQVSVSGSTLTIDPSSDLEDATGYYVEIPGTAIRDLAGNFFAGISGATAWNFTTASAADTTPPSVTAFNPADNSTGVALDANLVVTFSEDVVKGSGNILVRRTTDDSVVHTIDVASGIVSVSGNVVTINPSSDFVNSTGYYVEIPGTAFKDASNNFYTGTTDKNTWNFTTVADTTAPTLVSMEDGDADNSVTTGTTLTYTITFSEDIDAATVTAGDFDNQGTSAISVGPITETSAGVFTVEITPTSPGTLTLRIPAGAVIADMAGNALVVPVSDNDTVTVSDPDTSAPTVTSIVDDRSGAAINANLPVVYTITFSEDINFSTVSASDFDNAGTAAIAIGAIAEPSPGVVTVTVTPTSPGTLQLRIPGGAIIADTAGNNLVPPVTDDTVITVNAVTVLAPGDIAFSAYQADNAGGEFAGDAFAFVLLEPVVAGTAMFFTDNGYRTDTGTFRTNENMIRWVAQTDLSAGTKVVFVAPGGTGPASSATWTGVNPQTGVLLSTAAFGLAGGGDNITAIQNPTFGGSENLNGTAIAQITFGGTSFATTFTNASGNSHTALAPGLIDGLTAVSLTASDDGQYNDAAFGSVENGPKSVVAGSLNTDRFWLTSTTPFSPGNTAASFGVNGSLASDLYINEVVFNPLSDPDTGEEYIELRGTPNGFVPANTYLMLIEGDSEDGAGNIDQAFFIGGMQFGSSGYLVLRSAGSTYTVSGGATDVVASGTGWGTDFSSRATDIENGSVSVLLIQWSELPIIDTDVDANDDGTLDGVAATWTIRDSIGNIDGGVNDTGYGLLNTSGNGNGLVAAGSSLINLAGYHPDYMGRNGNSTGYSLVNSSASDWVVGELAGIMPNISLATGGFTRPVAYQGASLNHIGGLNTFAQGNSAPTNISLSNGSVSENAGADALIGTLSATDPDSGDTFTFSLPAGVDNNSLFNVSGTSLRANASFDFESGASYTVTARVTDAGGLTFDKQFTITITNVNEGNFQSNIFYNLNAASERLLSPDKTGQRSMVREVQVVFTGDIVIPAGPVLNGSFVATRLGATNTPVGVSVISSTIAAGQTTVVLRFTSSVHAASGSLIDGNYRLVIDYGVLGIDGDGNSVVGGTRTINFHRFFGDSDGDRDVDARDSANYRSALLGASSWRSVFDFDNDGFLVSGGVQDKEDKDAFFANFGRVLNPF